MNIFIYILIFIIGIIILYFLYWFFFKLDYSDDIIYKGILGEVNVLSSLENWILEKNINAKAYRYKTPKYETQAIDLLLDSTQFPSIGIEVKYRNIEHIQYLKLEHISRYHQNGNRQSTKQLYGYIQQTNRLGLYAFVFDTKNQTTIHFLPHYIIEKMIETNTDIVSIEEIVTHPHGYS